jgi:hypothetical protein
MESYPVDIDPAQVVRWVKAEGEAAPSTLRVSGKRSQVVDELPLRQETHLGDAEREDLAEVETVATLEIAPSHASEGWLLSIVVEDEIGPRQSYSEAGGPTEQSLDLGAFYKEFIRPGRGTANVIAQVQDSAAKVRLTRLIEAIETNRHTESRPHPRSRFSPSK